jgi:crotonobetainyl-CoA:carnitine CoA-transferase CaiB-like acyl-CoA transferase
VNGVRVLDLTRVLAGPWATQHLADQGADVVKIEPPGGDETRAFGPYVDGHSTYFLAANRNKQSIVLDLRTNAGKDVLGRLVDAADVLVENFRPGVAERLGFGWADVHRRNPRLVYVAIHGFGDDGDPAWIGRPGYDLVLQALGGGMAATGFPGSPPLKNALSTADLLAGLWASQAVLLGLLERERTGRTQKIVVDMMQSQAAALAYHATRFLVAGEVEEQRGNAHRGLVPYDTYRCRDGWLALACGNDAIWTRLVAALGLPDRPEWATNAARVGARRDVDALVAAALAPRAIEDADRLLAEAGVPAGPVLPLDRTLAHPSVELVAAEHVALGTIRMPGPGVRTLTTRTEHVAPPVIGQDRDRILEVLGYDPAGIAALSAGGAFGEGG